MYDLYYSHSVMGCELIKLKKLRKTKADQVLQVDQVSRLPQAVQGDQEDRPLPWVPLHQVSLEGRPLPPLRADQASRATHRDLRTEGRCPTTVIRQLAGNG